MDFETITLVTAPGCELAQGIRVLTLNRPGVMNAMNTRMFTELRAAVAELAEDPGLRVLILTGAGTRAFCTGGDLKERNGMSDETWRAQHRLIEEAFLAVKDFPLPVIAAVGACLVGLTRPPARERNRSRHAGGALPEEARA